jgi:hypothetical protein
MAAPGKDLKNSAEAISFVETATVVGRHNFNAFLHSEAVLVVAVPERMSLSRF